MSSTEIDAIRALARSRPPPVARSERRKWLDAVGPSFSRRLTMYLPIGPNLKSLTASNTTVICPASRSGFPIQSVYKLNRLQRHSSSNGSEEFHHVLALTGSIHTQIS
jgi:hypothetical protein